MAVETGSIDLTAQKEAHDDAAKTATNYIEADSDGIKIFDSSTSKAAGTYQHQTASKTEFFVGGNSAAEFGGNGARVGKESASHVEVTDNSVSFADKTGEVKAKFAYVEWGDQPSSWGYQLDTGQWQSGNGNACGFGEDIAYLMDGTETWDGLMVGWVKTGTYTFMCVRVAFLDIGCMVTGYSESELTAAFGSPYGFFSYSDFYSYNLQFDANARKAMVRRSYSQSTAYDVGYIDTEYDYKDVRSGKFTLDTNLGIVHSAEDGSEHGVEVIDQSSNGRSLLFGVGTGQVNRGIYDRKLNRWIVHSTDSAHYAGVVNTTTKATARSSIGVIGGTIDAGTVSANTVKTLTKTFPSGQFSSAPVVTATLFSSGTAVNIGDVCVSVSSVSASQVQIKIFNNRSSTISPAVTWMAVGS